MSDFITITKGSTYRLEKERGGRADIGGGEVTLRVVNVSGGLASFEALRRTIEKHGRENTNAVFADVRGDTARDSHAAPIGSNWDGEDDDIYRFLADIERLLGIEIHRVKHPEGIGVWGAIFRERAITINMPNGTFAPCTKLLKMQTLDAYVDSLGVETITVAGLTWTERARVESLRKSLAKAGRVAEFPLLDEPLIDNCHITAYLADHGIAAPSMYFDGFPHGNCGGACVKAGIRQWLRLLAKSQGRYLYNEAQETLFRATINGEVSILTEIRGGVQRALPLSELRRRVEAGESTLNYESGASGCGCFAQVEQIRMESLVSDVYATRKAVSA